MRFFRPEGPSYLSPGQRPGLGVRGLLCLLLLLLATPLRAQTASLVKDINTAIGGFGSGFGQLTAVGGQLFFVTAASSSSEKELWVSGGTPESTHMVRDFCPGDCNAAATIVGSFRDLVLVSARAGFAAPARLWRSDGTRTGTFPLSLTASLDRPVLFNGAVYLTGCAEDGSGCDLWKTDGSQAGTVRLSLAPQEPRLSIDQVIAIGPRLYFTAYDANSDAALWTTDGTPAGTHRLRIFSQGGHGTPRLLTAAGNRLFFGFSTEQDMALWTSDGTPAGTLSLHAFSPIVPAFWGEGLHVLGGKVYFVAHDEVYGKEIWTSDGTPAGTRRATGFSFDDIPLRQLHIAGNRIVFLASDGVHGVQIWSTAGTPESVTSVPGQPCTDECSFLTDSTPLTEIGGRILFYGSDDAHGAEPWVTDGTAAGTRLVADLCPGTCGAVDPFGAAPAVTPQGLFFTATDPVHGEELWRTDGTAAGTVRRTDVAAPEISFFGGTAALGAKVYFGLGDTGSGAALWESVPPAGARRVAVVAPRGPSSDPFALTSFGGNLLFAAWEGVENENPRLWRSGGSAESTALLGVDIRPFTDLRPTAAGGFLFFVRQNQFQQQALWRTDGTAAGTLSLESFLQGGMAAYQGKLYFSDWSFADPPFHPMMVSDGTLAGTALAFVLPLEVPQIVRMAGLGSDLFFSTGDLFDEGAIWHSDGTREGTKKIATFFVPSEGYDPHFTRLGARVVFRAGTVWATDGTAAGTTPLFPVDGPLGQGASDLVVFQGAAYFLASGPTRTTLWRTDGTPGGTVPVQEIQVYLGTFPPRDYLMAGAGRLWLIADDGVHGEELWTSDGTPAGTALLRDINPGAGGANLSGLTAAGDRMFFAATDGVHGIELWQSDGTAAGTRMAQDIAPFAASSAPAGLTVAGDRLYFSADDGPAGRELWSLPLFGTGACQASDTALCLGGRYRVEARWRDFAGHAGAGHAGPLTGDTGTFWFFSPTNVETIVKVLDGQGTNGHAWVFYGALSSVEYTLTVTDTQTGLVRQYFNPLGQLSSVGDTHGFGPLGAGAAAPRRTVAKPSPLPLVAERTDRAAAVPCQASAERLCLNNNRFAVEVAWKDFQNHTGKGKATPLTGGNGETGAFWFFDAANIELVVKALDGRPSNGKFWLFYGALSNVEYTLTVTDTQTGTIRTYRNPSGRFASVADTSAF